MSAGKRLEAQAQYLAAAADRLEAKPITVLPDAARSARRQRRVENRRKLSVLLSEKAVKLAEEESE